MDQPDEKGTNLPVQAFDMEEKDRQLGALCYGGVLLNVATGFLGLACPVYILATDHKDKYPLKFHAYQALVTQLAFIVLTAAGFSVAGIFSGITSGCGAFIAFPLAGLFSLALFIMNLFYGYKVYKGEAFTIPYVTDFVTTQINK